MIIRECHILRFSPLLKKNLNRKGWRLYKRKFWTCSQSIGIGDGGIDTYDKIYFNSIGSGSIQAQNTLLFQKHSKQDDLKTTVYNVFKAKRNAEVMQGVGKETDIGYLNNDGITMLDNDSIGILDDIYNVELKYGREHQKLNDLNIG